MTPSPSSEYSTSAVKQAVSYTYVYKFAGVQVKFIIGPIIIVRPEIKVPYLVSYKALLLSH